MEPSLKVWTSSPDWAESESLELPELLESLELLEPQAARLNTIVAAITKANNFFFILVLLFIKTKSDLYGAFSAPPAVRNTGEVIQKSGPATGGAALLYQTVKSLTHNTRAHLLSE